ncbi:MAG: U32 family peptidase, partial [Oscillospiraceae bacterium]|nr:U32 family peptidase [Oscillospiraceae bacterium]
MKKARELGIKRALVGNIGQILSARNLGFEARGDFGLNAFNSQTLRVLKGMKLISATLPFEMKLTAIRDMQKPMDTELVAYGRLPLMVTESCIVRDCMGVCTCDNYSGLTDGTGASYPVVREFGCRNTLLASRKLFMADRRSDLDALGLWAIRLSFTTESARECASVLSAYLGESDYKPSGATHGVYYRGVV